MQAGSNAIIGGAGRQTPVLWRRVLQGVTLAALLALCLVPASRGIFREQIALTVASTPMLVWADRQEQVFRHNIGGPPVTGPKPDFARETARMRDFAHAQPDDPQIQLALAWLPETGDALWADWPSLHALGALSLRFPKNPSFAAAYLRDTRISDDRTEDYTLDEMAVPANYHGPVTPPGELAAFDQAAAHGEKIDPENAFFPFTRIGGLLAAHRDAAAMDALSRASRKPRWQDYEEDEQTGKWRLMQSALGASSAVEQSALLWTAVLAKSRHVARVIVYKAILAEKAGHPAQGLAIRHALMRCGSLMCAGGSSSIDALIGSAITQIAMSRPGGVSYRNSPPPRAFDETLRWRRYTHYLSRSGHAQEARWVNGIFRRQHAVREIILNNSAAVITAPLQKLLARWTADTLMLANLGLLLFLGAALRMVGTRPRRFWSRAFIMLLVTLAVVGLALWLTRGQTMLNRMAETGDISTVLNGIETPPISPYSPWAWASLALIVPLLMVLGAAIAGRLRRTPFTANLRGVLLPAVCLLTLLYGYLMIGTLRQEHRVSDGLTQIARHAGPYLAQYSRQTWPP